jgi:hypothetical protein
MNKPDGAGYVDAATFVAATMMRPSKLGMESGNQPGGLFRRALHGFVYGICTGYFGITPPAPEKELRFLGWFAAVLALLALVGAGFGWLLIGMVFKR